MEVLPPVGCSEAYRKGCQIYSRCSGRSRRSECWCFFIGVLLNSFIILNFVPLIFIPIAATFLFIPLFSNCVRRLHDIGKSGYFIFLLFIPIIGWSIFLYYMCKDSDERQNEYGPSPKYILPGQLGPIGPVPSGDVTFTQPYISPPEIPPQDIQI